MKQKTLYVCQQCGTTAVQWKGRCSSCGEWNSLVEEVIFEGPKSKQTSAKISEGEIVKLDDINPEDLQRLPTYDSELNRVLGDGIVPGSVVLIGGEPGIGKSTILLQLAIFQKNLKILYICGEESLSQVKLHATRLGGSNENCYMLSETTLEKITAAARELNPDILIVDSIQTVQSIGIDSTPGSVVQIRECTSALIQYAKKNNTCVFLIGHITKEGYIAGPKILEHMVDTVLYFEGDRHYNYRILRTMKNRFGSMSEIGIYEMGDRGLKPIENPSDILLTNRDENLSGIAIAATLEGIRPMLIEVQALASPSAYGTPQRSATGFDAKRMNMLLAVLEKRCGLKINMNDVFLNIAGGLRVEDPATDVAVAVSVASSMHNIPIPHDVCFAGEIGLSGEVRPVNQIEKRIKEAEKLGFKSFHLSTYNKKSITAKFTKIELIFSSTLDALLGKIMG
ncbi:MAG: DNA repair protein RadA [Bacteroidetes bacterium]|nr:DNA repair protein RadA [Bacteroidota bacterium]